MALVGEGLASSPSVVLRLNTILVWFCPGVARATVVRKRRVYLLLATADSFASHLLQAGCDSQTMLELLVHSDVATTMICTRVLLPDGSAVRRRLVSLACAESHKSSTW